MIYLGRGKTSNQQISNFYAPYEQQPNLTLVNISCSYIPGAP